MFTSTGLFRDIPCPLGSDCTLVSCIFSHGCITASDSASGETSYDLLTARDRLSPPPQKRRRIERTEDPDTIMVVTQAKAGPADTAHVEDSPLLARIRTADPALPTKAERPPRQIKLSSAKRPVSPPPVRDIRTVVAVSGTDRAIRCEDVHPSTKVMSKAKETLNPRLIAQPPQTLPKRRTVLMTLHAAMKKLNDQMSAEEGSKKQFTLPEDELVLMANDEEEQMALNNTDENMYRSVAGQRVMKLRKMDTTGWKSLVLESYKQSYLAPEELKKSKIAEIALSPELTQQQESAVLRHMQTPLEGLEDYGYVTKPPSEAEISNARRGVEINAGFEECDRCKTRFQVFPGRDEWGRLTSGGACRYHYAKLPFRAAADATYGCCQRRAGSEGCQIAETHVFKISDSKRLASIWQYMTTPGMKAKLLAQAVAIDCEMGYTTLGMEMIRLSAVSWPQGKGLLDVLVRPKGEILDLNTRYSGVSRDQFNNSTSYGTMPDDNGDSTSEDGQVEDSLVKVDSPECARDLLFELLDPDTPLIGHAIDNDLNVCRIIHPFVVDTVLLYPHPRGLPIRYALRMLTSKYLKKNIQLEGTGHDSKVDAQATGDLVRLKVHEQWQQMKRDGWSFKKGILSPPLRLGEGKLPTGPKAMLAKMSPKVALQNDSVPPS